ncbi:hypothetical protein IEO21_09841 [Rhodonia placenta]|uniref:C2H2-type domain-containing protein n=1 Tax=Rhodonia placenta TaxID=104341 RepID=A0A8H7NTP2_9APHY|nr:hypothetical protein IEO21_09841 [Postia placenta]
MGLFQFPCFDPQPLPLRHLVGVQQSALGPAPQNIAIHETCLPLGYHHPGSHNPIQYLLHPPQNGTIHQADASYGTWIFSHDRPEGYISIPLVAPDVAAHAAIPIAMDPFAHIDPYILDQIAMGSGTSDIDGPRYTPSGQDIDNTIHINSASRSNNVTESLAYACALPTAETSGAPAYKFRRRRSSTKANSKTTSRRSRAPAVIATTPDETTDGPIKCKVCGKKFSHRQNLNRHVRITHLGARKWDCVICSTKNSRHDALKRHLNNIHNLSDLEAKHIVTFVGEKINAAV